MDILAHMLSQGIEVNKAAETFKPGFPFKIYSHENGRFGGTKEHTHDYIQIWYVKYGSFEHVINNVSHPLVKGNIFVLPPFIPHKIAIPSNGKVKILCCEFSTSFVNENITYNPNVQASYPSFFDFAYLKPFLVMKESIKPGLQLEGSTQAKVESLYEEMQYEYDHKLNYYEINIKADLLKLLAIISREQDSQIQSPHKEIFDRYRDSIVSAVEYINKNYAGKIYIEDVCKIAMVSQPYFSYLFRQITGKSFTEYINRLRIGKAIDIMCSGNGSITDICYSVGFNDSAYFSRVFKKETGFSPLQYRNKSFNAGGSKSGID